MTTKSYTPNTICFFLSLIVFGVLSHSAWAQHPLTAPYRFRHFTMEDGLNHNRLYHVYQDQLGFIWVGTENGVCRFDGSRFNSVYTWEYDSTGLLADEVLHVSQDSSGHFWMQHRNGFAFLDDSSGVWKSFPYDSSIISRKRITPGLYSRMLSSGWLLMSDLYSGQIWKIHFLQDTAYMVSAPTENYNAQKDPPANTDADFLEDPDGSWYLIRHNEIIHYSVVDKPVSSFSLYPDHRTWLGSYSNGLFYTTWEKGLFRFDLQCQTTEDWRLSVDNRLANIIYSFLPLEDSLYWLGTESGLIEVNDRIKKVTPVSLLPDYPWPVVVKGQMRDRDGNIWVATDRGLFQMNRSLSGFDYLALPGASTSGYENPMYQLVQGKFPEEQYAVSREGYLYILRQGKVIQTLDMVKKGFYDPTRIFRDSRGNWWILTRNHFLSFDPDHRTFHTAAILPRRKNRGGLIWTISEDHLSRLWLGLSRDGLLLYDPADSTSRYISCEENGFCALGVLDLQMDTQRHRMWIATESEGLWEGDLDQMRFHKIQLSTPDARSDRILGMDQDNLGRLWVGTPRGIYLYQGHDNQRPQVSHIPLDAPGLNWGVEGLVFDGQSHMWGGGAGSLTSIDVNTFRVRVFGHHYGVDISPYPLFSLGRLADGRMFAGGKTDFLTWNPASLSEDSLASRVLLGEVNVNGVPYVHWVQAPTLQSMQLNYKQNNLSFSFSPLLFTPSTPPEFEWMLAGYDQQWHHGTSPATYTRVPPGHYDFSVRLKDHPGTTRSMEIRIRAAFWQTLWFRSLLVGFLLISVAWIYRVRISRIREQEALKSRLQQKMNDLEMTALRAQIHPHFIFNCLNSINRFIQMNEADTASMYLTKFARLIRLVLDMSRENLIPLDRELDMLKLFLEMEHMRFSGRFSWSIRVKDEMDVSDVLIPPLILQPYVENAIWHGLMNRDDNLGCLYVDVQRTEDSITIRVEDNGVGREIASILKSKNASLHKSYGMSLTQERLSVYTLSTGKSVDVKIEDLKDDRQQPAGTAVILTLPTSTIDTYAHSHT